MTNNTPHILLAEDEQLNIDLIKEFLVNENYVIDVVLDGLEAWKMLENNPQRYDVILLDRMMPNLDGISLLGKIKAHDTLKITPVILQTALSGTEEVQSGLAAGAYYYLTKPYNRNVLLSIIKTAITDYQRYKQLNENLIQQNHTLALLQEAHFRFQTLAEGQALASLLANTCPEPGNVIFGLSELLINAVEHGNLEIGYDEKSKLHDPGEWKKEVESRLKMDKYKDRYVDVYYKHSESKIEITIKDQGNGFDWKKYGEISPERAFDTHGRGIAISKNISFNEVNYQGNGNTVTASLLLN